MSIKYYNIIYIMPNQFSFLKNNVSKDIKLSSSEDIDEPVSGTVKYTVRSEDVSDLEKLINNSYELIKNIKRKKSTIPEEKLDENINANSD